MKSLRFTVALLAILGFSCVVYAAKGPCVPQGLTELFDISYTFDDSGNAISETRTTTMTFKGRTCLGVNEDNCNQTMDYDAINCSISIEVYERVGSDGKWILVDFFYTTLHGLMSC